MSKTTSEQSQGVFSFFDEVEKTEPVPKPRRQPLRPPEHIELVEAETEQPDMVIPEKSYEPEDNEAADEINENDVKEEAPENIVEMDTVAISSEIIIETVEEEQEAAENNNTEEELTPVEENEKVLKKQGGTRGRRSVKDNSIAAEMVSLPDDEVLFQKQYYSMGEVTSMFNENHSLIRYWESEFDILKPKKNGKGDRFFRPVDVKNLYLIYDLLRRRKFTIDGAREYLKNSKNAEEKFAAVQSLQKIKTFFLELKANL